ncbi:MAG: hypothetical protein B6I22_03680 [Desulfobacteraceae bacterium 4572_123]|nr:MAG: hypothetical protein B6I22_03680 [Desulfobacteraceae bacterium 4572_123]
MFGIGMPEMILILAVALIVIGPKKLPDLAKSLGRAMGEFKRATSDFKETMAVNSEIRDVKETIDDIGDDLKESMNFDNETSVEAEMDLQSASSGNDAPTSDSDTPAPDSDAPTPDSDISAPKTDEENSEGSKPDA